MEQFPDHVLKNIAKDKAYYSMDRTDNIERCKVDECFLGDCMLWNENLIWHSVHKYVGKPEVIVKNHCVEKDDILQLGRMGFIKAVRAFDVNYGSKFSSFAVTAIVREIRCFLRDSGSIIRPTRTANELINRINRLEHELSYLPAITEVAILLNEDEEKVTKAIQVGQNVKYLEEPLGKDAQQFQQVTLLDILEDGGGVEEDVVDKVYVDNLLETVRRKLTDKELQVVMTRVSGLNQTQTAEKENISQMRVSRIMKKVAKILNDSEGYSMYCE